jgi:hypothetical protein
MSPVRAKVAMMSSLFENAVAKPFKYETGTLKYPDASVMVPVIAKIAKSLESSLLLIRTCPLSGLVESSIVLRNC